MSDDSDLVRSASRVIKADPQTIFDVIADPRRHKEIDGSGTVRGLAIAPKRLRMGSRFGMLMLMGLPYPIVNWVVEYDEGRRIAWRHFNGHRWRYELEPVEGGTVVTETFDGSTAHNKDALRRLGFPDRNEASLAPTLERLAALVET